ncbi:transglycosylase SLT domain-containing protein, partial [Nocardia wallacei]|uniref:transglycosylase SLT domain-containing protein n=2 Tax=Nocardia wallacei TaxID=480035 RepID=UPI0024565D80
TPTTPTTPTAAARTAVSATRARAAFAAVPAAGGPATADVQPAALASTIAATADSTPAPAEPAAAQAPAPEAAPAPMPAPLPVAPPPPPPAPSYPDNLDGWIREALDIMAARGIPGSYDGIFRNIMRESTGNPQAINLYDSNAAAGIPSKGLLQVIDPTFQAYHVEGTPYDVWDPVANIVAACNYAAHRYGSMDNVNSAY